MSGHSKWAKIKHKKAATDASRGAAFTKVTREITAAAKEGGGNQDHNIRLRAAVARAKEINMPNANVENAIKKGTGELPGIVYENVTFDAYGPAGVAILIEGLTDNKNRTTAEIRNILAKKGGSMAGAGSTSWMFSSKGYITIEKKKIAEDALMEIVLDAGGEDIKSEGEFHEITCDPANLEAVKKAITAKGIAMVTAELTKVPSSSIAVHGNDVKTLLALMENLEEQEDVQAVHANFDISEEEMAKVAAQG